MTYRRDKLETEAMLARMVANMCKEKAVACPAPLNPPGCWDFFLSHSQAVSPDLGPTPPP